MGKEREERERKRDRSWIRKKRRKRIRYVRKFVRRKTRAGQRHSRWMNEDCEVGTGFFIMNIERVFKGALGLENIKNDRSRCNSQGKRWNRRTSFRKISSFQILTAITFRNDNEFPRYMRRGFLRLKINLAFWLSRAKYLRLKVSYIISQLQ